MWVITQLLMDNDVRSFCTLNQQYRTVTNVYEVCTQPTRNLKQMYGVSSLWNRTSCDIVVSFSIGTVKEEITI